jgi:hypothetical protein
MNNICSEWRRHFIIAENMLEVDCPAMTPDFVLKYAAARSAWGVAPPCPRSHADGAAAAGRPATWSGLPTLWCATS